MGSQTTELNTGEGPGGAASPVVFHTYSGGGAGRVQHSLDQISLQCTCWVPSSPPYDTPLYAPLSPLGLSPCLLHRSGKQRPGRRKDFPKTNALMPSLQCSFCPSQRFRLGFSLQRTCCGRDPALLGERVQAFSPPVTRLAVRNSVLSHGSTLF